MDAPHTIKRTIIHSAIERERERAAPMLLARDGGQIDIDSHSLTPDVRAHIRQAEADGMDAEEEAQERRPWDFVRPLGEGRTCELCDRLR